MGEILKVFISATSADLGTIRTAAKNELLTLGYFPIEQEHFGPQASTLQEIDRRKLEESDAVLHIVGERYGAEPPAAGGPRRSFTQWEYHIARELRKQVYLFVCADGFPYDPHEPEPEELRALQRAHREAILGGQHKRELIASHADFVRLLGEIDLQKVRANAENSALQRLLIDERQEIRHKLTLHIQRRTGEEIARLDPVHDWEKIAEWEKTREQQIADADRFLDGIAQVLEKQEASANYAVATRILAEKGPEDALRFLASKSGEREKRLAQLSRTIAVGTQAVQEKRELLREQMLTASLQVKGAQIESAEAAYRAIVAEDPAWSEPRHALAELLRERGIVIEPAEGNRKLREAVQVLRGILHLHAREVEPEDWARTQNNLGNALSDQGERAEGAESLRLLGEAVTAYRAALEVYTRAQLPQYWATTQNNLATALWNQGTRAEGAESLRLLGEAVSAYRAALEVRTRASLPLAWATTQNNLAIALRNQGTRAEGAESLRLLGEAVTAYRAALEVRTRGLPQAWAMTQNNLAIALQDQGTRAEGAERLRLLGEAVTAYRAALEVYTRDQLPQYWAMTQTNLAVALRDQARRAEGAERLRLLGEAVTAYRTALEVNTREQLPQAWASTQNNLAVALADQGACTEGNERQRLLGEAVAAGR
ncbi:MAG TPA: DUF4062 domain-containing protein, partial [Chthoniobacteraceae bacterium]|nr:DUF4062 domain-containing protein [Chthoniobacteraceae bacterium]